MDVETCPGDIMGPDYHTVHVVKDQLAIAGPNISITNCRGLGVEVDWDVVADHAIG